MVPGSDMFISALYEEYEKGLYPVMDKIQRYQIDKGFVDMISELCTQGHVSKKLSDMTENTKMRYMTV